MENELLKYGLAGIGLLAMGWFILKLEERYKNLEEAHRQERKDWLENQNKQQEENRKVQDKQFERLNDMTDKTNNLTRENTNILSGIKTLLEQDNRK